MNIVQFLKIFWARRLLILAATISCLVGALIVTSLLPPRWEAHSRLMLNLLKPDPVTGQIYAGSEAGIYAQTQIELITDYSVAGKVAEQLGWFSDPTLIAQYQKRSANDLRDYRHWLGDLVIANTKARLIQGSNILDITYTGPTAANAKGVADSLRKAYIDTSLSFRRQDAERNAEWFEQQAAKAKAALDADIEAQQTYERTNGIVMANEKTDVDSARLAALSLQGGMPPPAAIVPPATQASIELASVDAQIAEAAKSLGPNNPSMQALRARRAIVVVAANAERANARAFAGAASSGVGALERAVAAQKAKVIAQSGKIGRLSQLQYQVDERRDLFIRSSVKAAQYREEAVVGDAGITPLGTATTPKGPSFPNWILIIPGSLILGLGFGVLLALLMELMARRVRSVEDLASVDDIPVIGVIAGPARSPFRFSRLRNNPFARSSGRREMARI